LPKFTVKLKKVPVSELQAATWNYKETGTEEQLDKLRASIEHDGSPGVLAVRRLGEGRYEVIDGNHRLPLLPPGSEVWVEDFGEISKADAVTIALRRNHQWFRDDSERLSEQIREIVIPELGLEELESILPFDKGWLETMAGDWDWPDDDVEDRGGGGSVTLAFALDPELLDRWEQWSKVARNLLEIEGHEEILKRALKEALTGVTAER
jgi:hypothetical protein